MRWPKIPSAWRTMKGPMPKPSHFAVSSRVNASKILGTCSPGIPVPVSHTSIRIPELECLQPTRMRPPGSLYLIALLTKLLRAAPRAGHRSVSWRRWKPCGCLCLCSAQPVRSRGKPAAAPAGHAQASVRGASAGPTAEIYRQIKKAIGNVPNTFAAIGAHGPEPSRLTKACRSVIVPRSNKTAPP